MSTQPCDFQQSLLQREAVIDAGAAASDQALSNPSSFSGRLLFFGRSQIMYHAIFFPCPKPPCLRDLIPRYLVLCTDACRASFLECASLPLEAWLGSPFQLQPDDIDGQRDYGKMRPSRFSLIFGIQDRLFFHGFHSET